MKRERLPKQRVVLGAISAIALGLYCLSIWHVNTIAEIVPEERYEMGDWLQIENGYIIDEIYEKNDGYSLRIDDARLMSPSEFVERYGKQKVSGDIPEGRDDTVLAVTMTIKNEGNSEGGFDGFMWQVVPATNDQSYTIDEPLFAFVEDSGVSFKIKENTEHTVTFPFTWTEEPLFVPFDETRRGIIKGERFRLALTMRPEWKSLEFWL